MSKCGLAHHDAYFKIRSLALAHDGANQGRNSKKTRLTEEEGFNEITI